MIVSESQCFIHNVRRQTEGEKRLGVNLLSKEFELAELGAREPCNALLWMFCMVETTSLHCYLKKKRFFKNIFPKSDSLSRNVIGIIFVLNDSSRVSGKHFQSLFLLVP